MNTVRAPAPDMIDDLEDGDLDICNNGGRTGSWYVYNESTSGSQTLDVALESRGDSIVSMETIGTTIGGWGATMGISPAVCQPERDGR